VDEIVVDADAANQALTTGDFCRPPELLKRLESGDRRVQVERTAGTVAVALNLTLGDPDRQVIELIASALADELERREYTRAEVAALDDGMSEIRQAVANQLRSW